MGLLDELKKYVGDAMPGGLLNPEVTKKSIRGAGEAMSMMPNPAGDVASGLLAIDDVRQGNYGDAALNGLGLLPAIPSLGVFLHAGHAPKGGARGVNGEWYEGGKFMPTTEAAKKAPSKFPKGGKVEVAPWIYGQRPADDLQPLWNQFRDGVAGGTVRAPKGTPLAEIRAEFRQPPEQYLAYTFNGDAEAVARYIADKKSAIAAWNAGARYRKTAEDGATQYFDELGNLLDL